MPFGIVKQSSARFLVLLLFSSFSFWGCLRFRVETLREDLVTKIPLGSSPETWEGVVINQVLTNVPLSIPVSASVVALVDSKHSVIKLFDRKGRLEATIGNPDYKTAENIPHYPFRFGIIGLVAIQEDGSLVVQNRISSKTSLGNSVEENLYKTYSGTFSTTSSSILPSFLVHISQKGVVRSVLGASGKNSEPFRYLEAVLPGEGDRLFVYHRIAEEMRLSFFEEGELKGNIKESSLSVFRGKEINELDITLDKILPHPEGDYVLASFSYYSKKDKRFKFRRIYRYNFQSSEGILKKEIQDPSEILFSVRNNHEFYIWETEDQGNSIRLQVHDSEGNHINNKRLPFTPPRVQWRETYTDSEDNIYSIRIRQGALEIYRWI